MRRRGGGAARATVAAAVLMSGCGAEPAAPPTVVAVVRPVGSWEGTGNSTIGFASESGQFRVTWQTRREDPPGAGRFRLAAHSGVSGRPIQLLADHRGEGGGTAAVHDDPRLYNLMVESAHVEWSLSVEEVVAGYSSQVPEPR